MEGLSFKSKQDLMKLLLDENISDKLKKLFTSAGFDVLDLKEKNLRQLPDKKILEISIKEKSVIITHDKDFLTFMLDPNCKARIILLSIHPQTEERMTAVGKFLVTCEVITKITKSAIVYYFRNEISLSSV